MRMTGVSGSESHLLELLGVLRDHGWRSDVLIPSPRPAELLPFAEGLGSIADDVSVLHMRFDFSPVLVWRLVRALRSRRYDVAHAHLVHADWHLALAARFAPRVALVTTKHNPDPFRTGLAFRLVEKATLRRYAAVIAISDALRAFLAETVGARAVTVRYGLAPRGEPSVRQSDTSLRLVAVGRLEEQKGFDVAIDAMASIVEELPEARLAIAGEGSQERRLRGAIERLGLEGKVELLGRVEDVADMMRDADVFVHTARWEGFGLVLLEAMREGLPIVATRVGAIPEVVADGVTGMLVPPEDPRAVAAAVIELARRPDRRRDLGRAGFNRLREHFSPQAMGRGVAAVYDSLTDAR